MLNILFKISVDTVAKKVSLLPVTGLIYISDLINYDISTVWKKFFATTKKFSASKNAKVRPGMAKIWVHLPNEIPVFGFFAMA